MSKFQKVLITGITGSGGSYLADYITEHHPEVEIHGTTRWHSTTSDKNLEKSFDKVVLHECDLNDMSSTLTVLRRVLPDAIFHLAAYANVRTSFDTPLAVLQNNIMGTANLFEAVRHAGIEPMIQMCSTSEVYGQVDPSLVPIKEDCSINPANPYAVSKVTQDLLGLVYFKNYGMKVIRTRTFAYLNPRRSDLFATSFALQIARIEAGLQKELLHGNLDSVRTLMDVRDTMEAYWIAMEKCRPGEVYNLGGTTVIKVGDFLATLKKLATCDIPSRVDEKLLRPTDVTLQIPDTSKFTNETGWKPKFTFGESMQFLLDHCRGEVAAEKSHL